MGLSIRDAARETAVSKSTILRAIQRGRLSAARDADGNYQIDPSELFRVYAPRTAAETGAAGASGQGAPEPDATVVRAEIARIDVLEAENTGLRAQIELMRDQLAVMREQIDDLKGQRDGWQHQAEALTNRLIAAPAEPHRRPFGWFRRK